MELKPKLIQWLRDAHAIEESVARLMEHHAKAADAFPQLAQRLREHAQQSRGHAQHVAQCLKGLGSGPSAVESAAARVMSAVQAAADLLLDDQVLTNCTADCGVEQLEIATYCAIATAADQAGEAEVARACRQIIAEEQAMADWLMDHLPVLTRQYLS